ncbi:glutamic acid-rich protein isoform X2 [Arabidopsis lyrata subsp. lyrata]|uniref:glutamic acid-rich protein isoform X2 n=1 Tax=Arabidopsis lyrata subsp. lyrata TaxID=81972 RepID=UPI000A29D167|nr:glutamic acid-rich protein isoform X2 [Arabidopsis lyrata subsp. lyrata]|eukprot:XP_020891162.1 glutamic acid-rich protein isoform X2 [Arabidopsis lyrata subsp. lyrata]
MTAIVGFDHISKALIDAGKNLLSPPSSTDDLLTLLDETESLLKNVEQDQPLSMQSALIPSRNALVSVDLLSHPDSDVRVSVVSCLTEIVRIAAPEAPYSDDLMKDIFRLTIEAFEKLADASSRSYRKAEFVLDNVAKVKSCLVMLDLECYDLILQMFRNFLKIIRSDHPQVVFSSMEMIMIAIIDETEEVSTDLLDSLLSSVKKENQNVSPMSWSLAEKVLSRCARKLKPYIIEALKSTGTSMDMYSPVVSSICQSVFDTTKVHNIINTKEHEGKLDLGHSRKENLSKSSSKRPARDGTRRINEKEKVRNGNNSSLLKQSLKQVRSASTDAETELGITGKRGRKPNSLMNPEDYDISWLSGKRDPLKTSSNKKIQRKGSGGESSLGKVAAKKTPLPKETSPATSSRALTGSLKRSRVKMDVSDYDSDSLSSPRLKKLASCFRDDEESNQEEDDRKIGNSSKKTRSQNGLEKSQKTAKKKPVVEAKTVNSSGKRLSARSVSKRRNLERAPLDTPVPQSSKRKKMVSQVAARQLADESEETPKSHPTRRRTARKEVESDMNGFGEDLVGKRVNIWWPLDKRFYEGVIDSYCTRKKMHRVIYSDGDSEELNLIEERWELLEDDTSADEDKEIDLPESIPLSDIMQRQRVKKSKNLAVSVEPTSSSGVRSSSRTPMKKGCGKKLNKQGEKTREGKNLRSLKELNAETDRTAEEQEVSLEAESDDRREEDFEDDSSEKQEKSEDKGVEAETKEEEKQYPNSEVESEGEDSESEEEPKWRETDDMEDDEAEEEREEVDDMEDDEAEEEREEVDDKEASTNLSEIEKEEDEDEEKRES